MRALWTFLKVIVALALIIPLGFFALALIGGVVGLAVRLLVMALRLAFVGLIGYGLYRAARFFFGSSPTPAPVPAVPREIPSRDPYYEQAMREIDSELGRQT